jgi:alpha-galactosidase
VEAVYPAPDGGRTFMQSVPPAWLSTGIEATGRFLAASGLPMPVLNPEHGVLLAVRRVSDDATPDGRTARKS